MSSIRDELKWSAYAAARRACLDFFSPLVWLLSDKPAPSGMTHAEYTRRIAEGLAAADRAKADLAAANRLVEDRLRAEREEAAERTAAAERLARQIVEEAMQRAADESAAIVVAAREEAKREASRAREALREQVAQLAVKGAEEILRHELHASDYAEILRKLKEQL